MSCAFHFNYDWNTGGVMIGWLVEPVWVDKN